ncbi:hypothetical protein, partial [Burkholderia gladioli]|uniref:hypothetical protein n=1 Tax=Burkholderia gladioli TaxID=28095 RepID=UPI001ABB3795
IGCRFLKSVSAKQLGFFSSAAFSAAEKRDYDQHFAARQLLFFSAAINTLRRSLLSQTSQLPIQPSAQPIQPCFPFRTAFPLARKRRDSKQRIAFLQAFSQRICMKGAARAAPFMATR